MILSHAYIEGFPYGNIPREKPNMPLSKAMNRVYEGTYDSLEVASNELFSNFKYTPLKGFDYKGGDGTLSRRDATKIIRHEGNTMCGTPTERPNIRHRIHL